MLTGCNKNNQNLNSTMNENNMADAKTTPICTPLDIKTGILTDSNMNGQSENYSLNYEYIIIENKTNNESIKKLNDLFYEDAKAAIQEYQSYATDGEEEAVDKIKDENNGIITYNNKIEITYNDRGILSYINYFSENNSYKNLENNIKFSSVINVNTGMFLEINDILQGTEKNIKEIIGNAFMESETIDASIKAQYKEQIMENAYYAGFYLDDKGLRLYYDNNSTVPSFNGELAAYISYEADVFKDIWEENSNNHES